MRIVSVDLFDAVQTQFAANASKRRCTPSLAGTLPLRGIIFDAEGQRMGPSFAYGKAGKRHAYYVSIPLQKAIKPNADTIGRVSARPLESLVLDRLQRLSGSREEGLDALVPLLKRIDVEAQGVRLTIHADSLTKGDQGAALIRLQSRLAAGDRLDCPKRNRHTFQLIIPVRPVFRGGRTWMVKQDGRPGVRQPDASLVKALAQAHQGLARHSAAPTQSPAQWAGATGITESYLRRLTGAGFLAPDIQQAILMGRHPAGLTAMQMWSSGFPLAWEDQRKALGFPSAQ